MLTAITRSRLGDKNTKYDLLSTIYEVRFMKYNLGLNNKYRSTKLDIKTSLRLYIQITNSEFH